MTVVCGRLGVEMGDAVCGSYVMAVQHKLRHLQSIGATKAGRRGCSPAVIYVGTVHTRILQLDFRKY